MHVTSDYYRCCEHHSFHGDMGLVERWMRSVSHTVCTASGSGKQQVKPLLPSPRTLRQLARRYKHQPRLKHIS